MKKIEKASAPPLFIKDSEEQAQNYDVGPKFKKHYKAISGKLTMLPRSPIIMNL